VTESIEVSGAEFVADVGDVVSTDADSRLHTVTSAVAATTERRCRWRRPPCSEVFDDAGPTRARKGSAAPTPSGTRRRTARPGGTAASVRGATAGPPATNWRRRPGYSDRAPGCSTRCRSRPPPSRSRRLPGRPGRPPARTAARRSGR